MEGVDPDRAMVAETGPGRCPSATGVASGMARQVATPAPSVDLGHAVGVAPLQCGDLTERPTGDTTLRAPGETERYSWHTPGYEIVLEVPLEAAATTGDLGAELGQAGCSTSSTA